MKLNKEDFISGTLELYPPELLENRINTEACVTACIFKDALLIDDSDLSAKDFITSDGRYYFSLAKHLRDSGLSALDEVAVTSSISDEMTEAWEEHGGWSQISTAVEVVDTANFNKYLGDLYKANTILALYKDGFNLMTEIKDGDKRYRPLDLFKRENWTAEMIVDWYEMRMSKVGVGYSNKILEEEEIEFDDEFIESCESGDNDNGVQFDYAGVDEVEGNPVSCLPFLSKQIGGIQRGGLSCLAGYVGTGKSTLAITILMGLMENGEKVLIISNEERIRRFKIKCLVFVIYKYFKYYSVTRNKIKNGNLSDEDKKYLRKAQKFWNEHYKGRLKFIAIADSDMVLFKKKVRENVLRYGYSCVFYDTLKLDMINETNGGKEYLSIIKDTRMMDELAKRYNLIMLCSMQLALHTLNKVLFLDGSCLSGAKAAKEVMETLLMIRNTLPEELDSRSKIYCSPYRLEHVDGKWVETPFEADPSASWITLFVDKNRESETSQTNGKAYLLKFDGAHSIYIEKAMCRPKRVTM